jgi:hypothetical protein
MIFSDCIAATYLCGLLSYSPNQEAAKTRPSGKVTISKMLPFGPGTRLDLPRLPVNFKHRWAAIIRGYSDKNHARFDFSNASRLPRLPYKIHGGPGFTVKASQDVLAVLQPKSRPNASLLASTQIYNSVELTADFLWAYGSELGAIRFVVLGIATVVISAMCIETHNPIPFRSDP